MKIVISKNPISLLNSQSSSSLVLIHVPSLNRTSCSRLLSSGRKWTHGSQSLRLSSLRALYAPSSTTYGGWDDVGIVGGSEGPGESDAFRKFFVSVGIYDRNNIFVFLLGLVCAVAISRVRISSVIVLPASVLVFAFGFTVGFFRKTTFRDVRINGSKRRAKEENLKLAAEKLRSLVEFFDELDLKVNNLKSNVQVAVSINQIKVGDLEGYVKVTDSLKLSALNARNIIEALMDNEDNSSSVLVENSKIGRRNKEDGETGHEMLQSIGSLFGEDVFCSHSTKVRENVEQETLEKVVDQSQGNSITPPVEDRALNSVKDYKTNVNLGSSEDSRSNSPLDVDRNGRTNTTSEKEIVGLGDMGRSNRKFSDEKEYSHQNNRLRYSNNHRFSLKMDSNKMWESHENMLNSENVNVRMEHIESESSFVHEQLLNKAHETYRSYRDKRESGSYRSQYREDRVNYDDHSHPSGDYSAPESKFNTSSSSKISDDMVFDRYLSEATDFLKQAKECIKGRNNEEQAEIMLYRSANLLSKAVDMKPMSLLAVGQLGNTYLLHGELKLKISRELRTLISGSIQFSSGKHTRILKGLQNKITSKEEMVSLIIDVCEECEELLVEAGRKYRLALSIDKNDVRALYNWGLALSFRGQLIADIDPGAAFEADRVFLAAIDKFDAMLSKGNVYASDALFRWGVALQQRSRLRADSSKEKEKLLQQAKRLYEDALNMDSNNIQVKDALYSCISELNYRQF